MIRHSRSSSFQKSKNCCAIVLLSMFDNLTKTERERDQTVRQTKEREIRQTKERERDQTDKRGRDQANRQERERDKTDRQERAR